jgi:hypothetical protein
MVSGLAVSSSVWPNIVRSWCCMTADGVSIFHLSLQALRLSFPLYLRQEFSESSSTSITSALGVLYLEAFLSLSGFKVLYLEAYHFSFSFRIRSTPPRGFSFSFLDSDYFVYDDTEAAEFFQRLLSSSLPSPLPTIEEP